MTVYSLKPQFQALLRPFAGFLAQSGVSANQVTLFAAFGSVLVGALVAIEATSQWLFLLIPAWLLLRMALNAIDGLLAREFDQKSALGAYLNEILDVVSDAALYWPFALIAPFHGFWIGLVILLSTLSEFAGALGPTVGASRRYDGPMGKSDRAVVFGVLGLAVGLEATLPQWAGMAMPLLVLLLCLTIFNRVRNGLQEGAAGAPTKL